jgi:hypothetical protein
MVSRLGPDFPGEHIQQIETFPQTNEVSSIEKLNKVSEAPVSQLVNDIDRLMTDIQEEAPLESKSGSTAMMDTLHSTPLDLPSKQTHQIETFPQTSEVSPVENHNDVLMAPILQLLNDRDHVLTNIQEEVVEMSPEPIHKPNPLSFPTLPEPMPLRKSMKPSRDPSMNAVLLGAATPGALVGGKRTSWLMRAREAKALEVVSNRSHPPGMGSGTGASASLTLQGTKRKGDPFSLPQAGTRDDERPPKFAKTSEGETFSYDSKDYSSMKTPGSVNMVVTSSTESQSQPPMTVQSIQEGVFDRLKKTVEGLGVRVSKSASKSVASDTATVLADARAAAKAKVAERDRKDEELTMALPAPETTEHKKVVAQELETPLTISDLFPTEGRVKEKHKVPEKPFQPIPNITSVTVPVETTRTSTSTTPPHSPPQKSQSFAIPSGLVFSKPSPVFVPPIQEATQPISSTVLKSSGQSTMAPGSSPHLTSLPKHVPLTAHSTLESIESDAVFDHDDVPAWMPSTQDTEYPTYDSQSGLQELVMSATKLADPVEVWGYLLTCLILSSHIIQSTIPRSQSQMSMASSDSSQSQGGFLGHASKLLSSTLGTSKKGRQPEVQKVLQMAAVAAKKVNMWRV